MQAKLSELEKAKVVLSQQFAQEMASQKVLADAEVLKANHRNNQDKIEVGLAVGQPCWCRTVRSHAPCLHCSSAPPAQVSLECASAPCGMHTPFMPLTL